MRGRPDVDVHLPAAVHPGDDFDLDLTVVSAAATPIDFIDLVLAGDEIASGQITGQQRREVRSIVHSGFRLREKGTLTEGTHRFAVRFTVPSGAPPSYRGVGIEIQYQVHLHVSIPWWPDLRESYELIVEPHLSRRPAAAPGTATSARGNDMFVELSLPDTSFAAGDEISGAFAAGNTQGRDGLGVEIALVATEHVRSDSLRFRAEQFRYIVPTVFRVPRNGGEVPFRFRVPKDVVASFESPWCSLAWTLHAGLRGAWGHQTSCAVPLHLGRHDLPREGDRARPEVGAGRWRRAWAKAGESVGLSLREGRLVLEGALGDIRISVALDLDDEETALIATLRYPSLELALRAAPQRLVLLPSPLEQLLPGYKVEARELAQGQAFFTPRLLAALAAFKTARLDDDHLLVRLPSPGHEQPWIGTFLEKTMALAAALAAAARHIPPPAAMHDALPAWRAFAATTGAYLAVGGMALVEIDESGSIFDLATLFDSEARITGTRLDLHADPPLPSRLDPDDPASFAAAPPGSLDLVLALRAAVRALKITPHVLTVELPGKVLDPAELRPRMAELLMLARRLRGERLPGPYR